MIVKIVILLMASGLCLSEKEKRSEIISHIGRGPCNPYENILSQYRNSHYEYLLDIYKLISAHSDVNFVFSANSLWLALAGMAEGVDSVTRQQLVHFLRLPEDRCVRQEYYKLARKYISRRNDVDIRITSTLAIDESLTVNSQWENLIVNQSLMRVIELPIKRDPVVSLNIMELLLSEPLEGLNFTGNSVLLDAVDYDGLWRTAFADASVELSPFYNQEGEHIGYVDLMRMKKQVRMAYMPAAKAKLLELPVAANSQYRMVFAFFETPVDLLATVKLFTKEMIVRMVSDLQETEEPVDVGIPRMGITSLIDFRRILEGAGIDRLWNDEAATREISEPAALPSSYVQRASLTLNTAGVDPPSVPEQQYVPPSDTTKGFVANKPFLFSLIDAETYTCLISVGFTVPTYSK